MQDTTFLNCSNLHEAEGLGYIGEKHMRGTLCHTTLAMNIECFPIGILNLKLWCRDDTKYGQGRNLTLVFSASNSIPYFPPRLEGEKTAGTERLTLEL